jgi:hypothetical protein
MQKKTKLLVVIAIAMMFFVGCSYPDENGNNSNSSDGSSSGTGDGSSSPSGGGGNTTKDKAISVTVGYSFSHNISRDGENWFKFVGTGETVIFETTGNVVDTYISVYEGSGWGNGDDNSGEGSNALYSQNTTLGTTYFIKVETRSNTSGTYTFVVE